MMKHKKRMATGVLCLAMILAVSTTTAFAATSSERADLTVEGSIAPVTLDVDVPIKTTFVIDADRNFQATEATITNNSPVPVTVTAASMTAKADTAAKVVSNTAHAAMDWDNLSQAQTQSQIALGLKIQPAASDLLDTSPSGATQWFEAEGAQTGIRLGTIKSAYQTSTAPKMTVDYDALYGKSWGSTTQISYNMTLTFSVD